MLDRNTVYDKMQIFSTNLHCLLSAASVTLK